MRDWQRRTIRELAGSPISGSRPSGGASEDTEGVPSLGGENIRADGGVTFVVLKKIPRQFFRLMPKGHLQAFDVLINKDGAQTGKVGFYDGCFEEAAVNEHLFILRSANKTIDQKLLYYYLLLPETQLAIARRITGSAQPGLNSQFVDAVALTVSLDRGEQRRIAEVLSTIDEAIEQTEALIAKTQQIKAGLMHNLFTRGVTPDGQLRPPREEAPRLYKESPLGWIPKEWDSGCLATRRTAGRPHIKTGPFGSSLKLEHWVEHGVPVITIGSLGEGEFIESELLYVSEVTAERLRDYRLEVGDIVFSRVADVGRSAVIREVQRGWIMSSNLMRISLDRTLVDPSFLQAQLAYDARLRKQIRSTVNSGGREIANSAILNRLHFSWPTLLEQELIVDRLGSLDARIRCATEDLTKLSKVKSGLMQDLLTGRVRVPEVKAPEPKRAANV